MSGTGRVPKDLFSFSRPAIRSIRSGTGRVKTSRSTGDAAQGWVHVSQETYAKKGVEKFGFSDSKRVPTPMHATFHLRVGSVKHSVPDDPEDDAAIIMEWLQKAKLMSDELHSGGNTFDDI